MNHHAVLHQFIKNNRHLSALKIQNEYMKQHKVIMPLALIKDRLEALRAEAHAAGSVTPR